MSSGRKSRTKKRKRRSTRSNSGTKQAQQAQETPEPKFLKTCKELYKQITALSESKSFLKLIPTNNKLYTEYKSINSHPISFETIKTRLYSKPCYYANYDKFNEDIIKIFYQEKRLRNYKGNSDNIVKKRIQNAKQAENYWNTLTASYKQFGFDVINNNNNNNNNKDDDDDSKDEENDNYNKKKKKESKKQKQNKKVLSNIKKRVKRGDESLQLQLQSANKRRKLNNDGSQRILTNSNNKNKNKNKNKNNTNDDYDSKREVDEEQNTPKSGRNYNNKEEKEEKKDIPDTDSPYTPFADKSRVFKQIMGNSDELFKNLQHPKTGLGIKKRLDFTGDKNKNHNNSNSNSNSNDSNNDNDNDSDSDSDHNSINDHTFEMKFKYKDSSEVQCLDVQAERMDEAVKKFYRIHSPSQVKIMTVTLTRNAFF